MQLFRLYHTEKDIATLEEIRAKRLSDLKALGAEKKAADKLLKEKIKEARNIGRDLPKIEQDIREADVEVMKKKTMYIKAKERVAYMQSKLITAKQSLAKARAADESHKKIIDELQEELRRVEETKASYEAKDPSVQQSLVEDDADVQLADEQVKYRRCRCAYVNAMWHLNFLLYPPLQHAFSLFL